MVKLPFALDASGFFVSVDSVDNGLACQCTCPGCHKPLVARQGALIAHHFAHHSSDACHRGLELALAGMARQLLAAGDGRIRVPGVNVHLPERTWRTIKAVATAPASDRMVCESHAVLLGKPSLVGPDFLDFHAGDLRILFSSDGTGFHPQSRVISLDFRGLAKRWWSSCTESGTLLAVQRLRLWLFDSLTFRCWLHDPVGTRVQEWVAQTARSFSSRPQASLPQCLLYCVVPKSFVIFINEEGLGSDDEGHYFYFHEQLQSWIFVRPDRGSSPSFLPASSVWIPLSREDFFLVRCLRNKSALLKAYFGG